MITNNDDYLALAIKRFTVKANLRMGGRAPMINDDDTGIHSWHVGPFYDANKPDLTVTPNADQQVRVRVNKTTHRIDFHDESEQEVTVTITPKGST